MSAVDLAARMDHLPLAVPIAYAPYSLWLVEHQEQTGNLVAQGLPRWRIWTLAELRDWLGPVESLAEAAEALTVKG